MRRFAPSTLTTALLAACLALAPTWALAGKPGSAPLVLTGTGSYVETPLFTSAQVLDVVQGEAAWDPVGGAVSMENAGDLRLTYGVEVDDSGVVYAVYQASAAIAGGTNFFTGVVRYDETNGLEVALARSSFYEGYLSESNQGEFIYREGIDRVPTQDASATGDLQTGDFIVSRWTDDTDVSDATSPVYDDRNEIVLFRPDASGQLVEERVLYAFDNRTDGAVIQVAADCFGNVYVWLNDAATAGSYTAGLYRLSYDASNGDYALTSLSFPFETNQYFDTDDAGNLYVQGAFGGDNSGVIFRLPAGGDPLYDATAYASYSNRYGAWTADNAATNGTLAMFLHASSPQLNFVGLAAEGGALEYGDRVAETGSEAYGMTADGYGSVYVAHEDRAYVSKNEQVVTGYTIYRLDLDTSGGGDSGGGGKGKKK